MLVGITFDVKFTYLLAGWEGSSSAHDSHVLNDALTRLEGFKILKVYRDKKYSCFGTLPLISYDFIFIVNL